MMAQRIGWAKAAPGAYKAMFSLHEYLGNCGLERELLDLIYLRASQINGCAFCIDMHWRDLRAAGLSEQHLYMLNAWRESAGYTPRERAALEWTEAVTRLAPEGVPDEVYQAARGQFSESELTNLTLAVVAINGWNRMNIAFRREVPSERQVAMSHG